MTIDHESGHGAHDLPTLRRMARSEHIDRLSDLDLFSGCSKRDLQNIAKASEEVDMAAGSTIVDQGDQGTEAYIVLAGDAVVRRNGRKIATLGVGDAIGEMSLLDHGPRTATVVADSDMRLLVLTSKDFTKLVKDTPTLGLKLASSLASRIRELDRQIFG